MSTYYLFDNVNLHSIIAFTKETRFTVDYNVVTRLSHDFVLT